MVGNKLVLLLTVLALMTAATTALNCQLVGGVSIAYKYV